MTVGVIVEFITENFDTGCWFALVAIVAYSIGLIQGLSTESVKR